MVSDVIRNTESVANPMSAMEKIGGEFGKASHKSAAISNNQMDFNKEEKKSNDLDAALDENLKNTKGQTQRETLSTTIKCNDGIMQVEVVSQEKKGTGLDKHTAYRIKG